MDDHGRTCCLTAAIPRCGGGSRTAPPMPLRRSGSKPGAAHGRHRPDQRPWWRGGRRTISAPLFNADFGALNVVRGCHPLRGTDCFFLDILPPERYTVLSIPASRMSGMPVLCADRSRAHGRMGRRESKGRERLRRPRPVYRIQRGSAWRHHSSGHGHGHPAHADRRKRVRHDRRVAQPDHRKNSSPMSFARLDLSSTIIPHGAGVVNAQVGKSRELNVGWTVVVMGSWPFVWLLPTESWMPGLTRSPGRRRAHRGGTIIGEPAEAGLVSLSPRLQPPGGRDAHSPIS